MPLFQRIGRDCLDLPQTPEIRFEHPMQMPLFRDFIAFLRVCRALKNLNADTVSMFDTALSADDVNTRGREAVVLQLPQRPAADDRIEFFRTNSHAKGAHGTRVLGKPGMHVRTH